MKQTLKLLMLVYVFALASASNAAGFNISDLSPTGASGEYRRVINAIRNNPHTSTFVNNIRQINASTSARSAFILTVNNVNIVLRSRDLYLIGFVDDNGNNFHHFNDVNPADVSFDSHQPYSNVHVTGRPTAHNIGFGSDYTSLERTGDRRRDTLNINRHTITGDLRSIRNYVTRPAGDPQRPVQGALASATLQTIITFVEAARFGDAQLAERISDALWNNHTFNTTTTTEDLVTSWSAYYNGVYNLVNQLNTFYAFFFNPSSGPAGVGQDEGRCVSNIVTAGFVMALLGVQQAGGGSRVARDAQSISSGCGFKPMDAMIPGRTYSLRLYSDEGCPMNVTTDIGHGAKMYMNCNVGAHFDFVVTGSDGNNLHAQIRSPSSTGGGILNRGSRYGLSSFYDAFMDRVLYSMVLQPVGNRGDRLKILYFGDRSCGLDWRPDDVLTFHCDGSGGDVWGLAS